MDSQPVALWNWGKGRKEGMTVLDSRALRRLEFRDDERGLRELGKITETLTKG